MLAKICMDGRQRAVTIQCKHIFCHILYHRNCVGDIAWKLSRFVWMEGCALLQFNVNEGLSHPAQPTNVLVGKMSSDKISDKSCDSHCVPESKPHRGHRDFLGTLL